MYVNPGNLDKKIQIIRLVPGGTNANGFPVPPTESIVREPWAQVTNTSGSEIIKANSEFSEAKKRFLIRYGEAEINTDMTVRYAGKDYDIEYVNPYREDKDYMEIWTKISERV